MATAYYPCPACGNSTAVTGRNSADAERRAAWMSDRECPACEKAAWKAACDAENAAAAARATERGLPELTGTPKQILYATTIRERILTAGAEYRADVVDRVAETLRIGGRATEARAAIAAAVELEYAKAALTISAATESRDVLDLIWTTSPRDAADRLRNTCREAIRVAFEAWKAAQAAAEAAPVEEAPVEPVEAEVVEAPLALPAPERVRITRAVRAAVKAAARRLRFDPSTVVIHRDSAVSAQRRVRVNSRHRRFRIAVGTVAELLRKELYFETCT